MINLSYRYALVRKKHPVITRLIDITLVLSLFASLLFLVQLTTLNELLGAVLTIALIVFFIFIMAKSDKVYSQLPK
ncbi:hypothetical protein VB10N_46540 [Vibrio sp. 10N]|nr:hypothetical protein VB10N_46540 [Vibrio sp. 10N]